MSYPTQPGYPQQQPPPGYPNQPGYPQQPPPPQPGYPQYPAQQPGYQQQQQPNYPPAAPPPPAPQGSLDGFMGQPANSGKSIASWFQTPGQRLTGRVARKVTDADTRAQTDMSTRQPKFYSDGRPMLTLTIPLQLLNPPPEFPDGRAAWIVNINDYRNEILPAMEAAGVPANADGSMPFPEEGALMTITFTGYQQIPGFGAPKKVKQLVYTRPGQAPQAPPSEQAAQAPQQGYPQGGPQPGGYAPQAQQPYPMQGPPQGGWQQPQQAQVQPQQVPTPPPGYPNQPAAQPPATGYPGQTQGGPEPMDEAHQALLQRLAGQQQAPPQA